MSLGVLLVLFWVFAVAQYFWVCPNVEATRQLKTGCVFTA
jgi:hypothetical protein